jgi:hypothetical protein
MIAAAAEEDPKEVRKRVRVCAGWTDGRKSARRRRRRRQRGRSGRRRGGGRRRWSGRRGRLGHRLGGELEFELEGMVSLGRREAASSTVHASHVSWMIVAAVAWRARGRSASHPRAKRWPGRRARVRRVDEGEGGKRGEGRARGPAWRIRSEIRSRRWTKPSTLRERYLARVRGLRVSVAS